LKNKKLRTELEKVATCKDHFNIIRDDIQKKYQEKEKGR
jgi:hypothetical protein